MAQLPKSISEVEDSTDLADHFTFIDSDGSLMGADGVVLDKEAYVDNIIRKFNQIYNIDQDYQLTIYIHGGLNQFNDTVQRVKNTYKYMMKDKQYPLFISWRSGLIHNYIDHLFVLRNGERAAWFWGIPSSPFVFIVDAARSVGRIPFSTWDVLFGQNSITSFNVDEVKQAGQSVEKLRNRSFSIHDKTKNYYTVTDIATIINPVKFFTAPIIDGGGTGAWGSMLNRADLVFCSHTCYEGKGKTETALAYFLNQWPKKNIPEVPINLIAHSAGTIIANNLLIQHPELNYKNVVYMAAACRLNDLK